MSASSRSTSLFRMTSSDSECGLMGSPASSVGRVREKARATVTRGETEAEVSGKTREESERVERNMTEVERRRKGGGVVGEKVVIGEQGAGD